MSGDLYGSEDDEDRAVVAAFAGLIIAAIAVTVFVTALVVSR